MADLRVYSKVVDDAGVQRIYKEGRNKVRFVFVRGHYTLSFHRLLMPPPPFPPSSFSALVPASGAVPLGALAHASEPAADDRLRCLHLHGKRSPACTPQRFARMAHFFFVTLPTSQFWIRPEGLEHNWGNIFHHGNSDSQRNPGIWFYPGNTRLHIRTSSVSNWNDGVDTPPHEALAFGKWSHVAVAVRSGDMRVFVDGELVAHHAIAPVIHYNGM